MSNFLTVDQLKQYTSVSKNTDITLLEPFISIAEEMHLYSLLGTALTTEIISQIDNNTLNNLNQTLLDKYIVLASAWSTFYEASVFLNFRSENKGITKKFSDTSTSLTEKEFGIYRQSILDKVSFYKNRLVDYLELNKSSYPLYRSLNCGYKNRSNSTGIWLG